jgi:hypothetical protein
MGERRRRKGGREEEGEWNLITKCHEQLRVYKCDFVYGCQAGERTREEQ